MRFGGALGRLQDKFLDKLDALEESGRRTLSGSDYPGSPARGSRANPDFGETDHRQYSQKDFLQLFGEVRDGLDAAAAGRLKDDGDVSPGTHSFIRRLVEAIQETTEAIVWGEKHNEVIFDLFCERQGLPCFVSALLSQSTPPSVKVQLLQTLSILLQNAVRDTSFYYLLSGGYLNTLLAGALDSEDDEIGYVYGALDLQDEEVLSYFVSLVKCLALRLDGGSAQLCVDERSQPSVAQGFPLFAQAVRFTTHRDLMVRTASRTALLTILRISHPKVRAHTEEAARAMLVPSLVRAFAVAWAAASAAVRLADSVTLGVCLEAEQDLLEFLNDVMLLDIPCVAEALARGFLTGALLPLLAVLAPPPPSWTSVLPGIAEGADDTDSAGDSRDTGEGTKRPSLSQEMAQALSSQTAGFKPAQRGFVGAVVECVLQGHASEASAGSTASPRESGAAQKLPMRMVCCSEEDASVDPVSPGWSSPSQSPSRWSGPTASASKATAAPVASPTAPKIAVAVRAVAACARVLGTHRSIVEPIAKVLLWPTLPPEIVAAVQSPNLNSASLSDALFAGANPWATARLETLGSPSSSGAGYAPQPASSSTSTAGGADTAAGGGEAVANPFRKELLALVSLKSGGAAPPQAPIVAWAMLELQAVLPRWLQEGVGLLPRRNRTRTDSNEAAAPDDDQEEALPVPLVNIVRAHARLPRIAQRAVASALVDLVSAPRARIARLQAAAVATEALQEAAELFFESTAKSSEDGSGADVLAAFLEEWEWHRHRDAPIDLPATCGGVQCLLRSHGLAQSDRMAAAEVRGAAAIAGHAARSLLTLRRLCADLTAMSEEGPQEGERLSPLKADSFSLDRSAGSSSTRASAVAAALSQGAQRAASILPDVQEFLNTDDIYRFEHQGASVSLGSMEGAVETIECFEPRANETAVQYTSSRTLVLHPTLLLVTEPPIGDSGIAVVRVRMPVWQVISSIDPSDPHLLRISTLSKSASPLLPTDVAMTALHDGSGLVLLFPDLQGSTRALMHIEGCKAREVKRLLTQLDLFVDTTLREAAVEAPLGSFSRRTGSFS